MDVLVQILINTTIMGGGFALLSLGFNLLYKTRKFIDVSYGSTIAIGSYAMLFFSRDLSLNIFISTILSFVVAILFALIFDTFVYNKFAGSKINSLVPLIASLGIYTGATAVLAMIFSSQYQSLDFGNRHILSFWGGHTILSNAIFFIVSILFAVGIVLMLRKTKFGQSIRAIDDDIEVAEITGIPTRKVVIKTIILSAVIATTFGIFVGFDVGFLPTLGLGYMLRVFVVAVMGGLGSIGGGIASGFIVSATENATAYFLSTTWQEPVLFVLFILVLLFRPNGIFSRPQK